MSSQVSIVRRGDIVVGDGQIHLLQISFGINWKLTKLANLC